MHDFNTGFTCWATLCGNIPNGAAGRRKVTGAFHGSGPIHGLRPGVTRALWLANWADTGKYLKSKYPPVCTLTCCDVLIPTGIPDFYKRTFGADGNSRVWGHIRKAHTHLTTQLAICPPR